MFPPIQKPAEFHFDHSALAFCNLQKEPSSSPFFGNTVIDFADIRRVRSGSGVQVLHLVHRPLQTGVDLNLFGINVGEQSSQALLQATLSPVQILWSLAARTAHGRSS
jgi:hypothetical protein